MWMIMMIMQIEMRKACRHSNKKKLLSTIFLNITLLLNHFHLYLILHTATVPMSNLSLLSLERGNIRKCRMRICCFFPPPPLESPTIPPPRLRELRSIVTTRLRSLAGSFLRVEEAQSARLLNVTMSVRYTPP